MRRWNLLELEMPRGTRDPVVLHSDDEARAVVIHIDAGQKLGEHQVKERAWVLVLSGSVRVRAGSEEAQVGPGSLFRFEEDERHSIASDDGVRILFFPSPWPGAGHYPGQ